MTRNEAFSELTKYWNGPDALGLINGLETLGVLKLEKEKPEINLIFGHPIREVIKALEQSGYIVMKQSGI